MTSHLRNLTFRIFLAIALFLVVAIAAEWGFFLKMTLSKPVLEKADLIAVFTGGGNDKMMYVAYITYSRFFPFEKLDMGPILRPEIYVIPFTSTTSRGPTPRAPRAKVDVAPVSLYSFFVPFLRREGT